MLAALSLAACEVGSTNSPKSPFRAPSSGNTGAVANSGTAEVGTNVRVTVTVKDKSGYGIGGVVPTVTAIGQASGTSAGVTSGGCSASDLNGISICSLSATTADIYTVKIVSPVTQLTTSRVTFQQFARSLRFSTQPSAAATAAIAFTTQPAIQVYDRVGNQITAYSTGGLNLLTAALTTPGSAALTGTTAVPIAAGTGTFAGLKVDKSGTYTLTATLTDPTTGAISAASTAIVVSAGAASQLVFTTTPGATATNVAFSPQPVIAVEDAGGNIVTTGAKSTCPVTLGISAGTGTLLGTLTVTAQAGVASFSSAGLRVSTTTANTITLQASTTCALVASGTATVSITLSGTPDHLAVVTAPSTSPLNVVWPTQPVVQVLDSSGAIVSTDNETVINLAALGGSPGGAGTTNLQGATSILVTNGQATFSGIKTVNAAGTYFLQFSGTNPSYPAVAANPVSVSQVINSHGVTPGKFAFSAQPRNVSIRQFEPDIVVQTLDSAGFFCSNDNTTAVTLSLKSGPVGGRLLQNGVAPAGGLVTVTAVNGLSTFSNIAFDLQGSYVLQATSGALTAGTSNTFAVAAFGAADHLFFSQMPASTGTTAGTPWSTQPKVQIRDVNDNVVTSDNTTVVTLSCTAPSTCNGLQGRVSQTAVNGLADFTGHNVRTGSTTAPLAGVVIHAATGSLIGTDADAFTENAGAALPGTHLRFVTQPADAGPYTGQGWSTQPVVEVLDINNARVTTDNTTIVQIQCAVPIGCSLTGTQLLQVTNGVANFAGAGLFVTRDHSGGTATTVQVIAKSPNNAGVGQVPSNSFAGN